MSLFKLFSVTVAFHPPSFTYFIDLNPMYVIKLKSISKNTNEKKSPRAQTMPDTSFGLFLIVVTSYLSLCHVFELYMVKQGAYTNV